MISNIDSLELDGALRITACGYVKGLLNSYAGLEIAGAEDRSDRSELGKPRAVLRRYNTGNPANDLALAMWATRGHLVWGNGRNWHIDQTVNDLLEDLAD